MRNGIVIRGQVHARKPVFRQERFGAGSFVMLFLLLLLAGCASSQKQETDVPRTGLLFEKDSGRSDMRLAILRPAGIGLDESEEKYRDLIQSGLNTDFSKFSDIVLSDRQNYDQLLEEQDVQLSGNYSDEDYVSLGQLIPYQYILTGTLTKVGANAYTISLTVSDLERGVIAASYTTEVPVTLAALQNLSATRGAAQSLLENLGVRFTPEGREVLQAARSAEEADTQNALALSYEAERNGDFVTMLIYSNIAADAGLDVAQKQADSAFKMMGGAGAAIRDDYRQRQHWQKNLVEFEEFYLNRPPFSLVYTTVPVAEGTSDYEEGTADFSFYIGLRHTRDVRIMQKVYDEIFTELKKTNYKKNAWGFNDWPVLSAQSTKDNPRQTPFFSNYQTFNIVAGLYNNRDERIGEIAFPLYGQLVFGGGTIRAGSTQERKMIVSGVDIEKISENMQIKIISINDKSSEDPENSLLKVTPVQKIPSANRSTIAKNDLDIPELPEEKEARLAKEARQQEKARKADNRPLATRFGFFAAGLYNPRQDLPDAVAVSLGIGGGYKFFSVEGWGIIPVRTALDLVDNNFKPFPISAGADLGYTWVWDYVLLSVEGGAGYQWLLEGGGIVIPNLLVKADLVPFKRGIALRAGYMADFAVPSWNDNYALVFTDDAAYSIGSLRVMGRLMFGLAFWL
jgi:hypothetical protein